MEIHYVECTVKGSPSLPIILDLQGVIGGCVPYLVGINYDMKVEAYVIMCCVP